MLEIGLPGQFNETLLTAQNFSSCFSRHQNSCFQINSQSNQKDNALSQILPVIRITIVLSCWDNISQFQVIFLTFAKVLTSLQTAC